MQVGTLANDGPVSPERPPRKNFYFFFSGPEAVNPCMAASTSFDGVAGVGRVGLDVDARQVPEGAAPLAIDWASAEMHIPMVLDGVLSGHRLTIMDTALHPVYVRLDLVSQADC